MFDGGGLFFRDEVIILSCLVNDFKSGYLIGVIVLIVCGSVVFYLLNAILEVKNEKSFLV